MTRAGLLAVCFASVVFGQIAISVRSGAVEQPVSGVAVIGTIYAGETAATLFRLRNVSSAPATVSVLAVDGTGFTIGDAPKLPVILEPQGVLDFSVVFQASNPGSYSAALHSDGVFLLLTATVRQSLTYTIDSLPLGAAPIVFQPIERFSWTVRRVRIENRMPQVLNVPPIAVQGVAFRLSGVSPSGTALQPGEATSFEMEFAPQAAGASEGSLRIGDRTFALVGSAFDPPLPQPSLAVALDQPRSARQGIVAVRLDAPARSSGAGTLTLEFQPLAEGARDPAIVFGNGARTVAFQVSPGDTQPLTAIFQTGTTAGTLTFVVSLGGETARQTITIAPAAVAISSVQSVRSANGVELRVTGFDNARAAGATAFTFFDTDGSPVAPGAIVVDRTADFARFFQTSDAGGNFLLRAAFPVTGDPSRIASYEVNFTTPAGTTSSGRLTIP